MQFEDAIKAHLKIIYNDAADSILQHSHLLNYIIFKTRSADKGSKSRSCFANLYALYVIIEDYINKGFLINNNYSNYEGAQYTNLFNRQRQLPFGAKLQNHALNHRVNEEFFKFFPGTRKTPPIKHNQKTKRYWINEKYLKITVDGQIINIAKDIIVVINKYITIKKENFIKFIKKCRQLQTKQSTENINAKNFIQKLLAPKTDARMFEIVSFSILKYYYGSQSIYLINSKDDIERYPLKLYKTGRTNANDGGIDFVMTPLGRFFQVTETLNFEKYFLDIEKIERYPITFVIKTSDSNEDISSKLYINALKKYDSEIAAKYMDCIEEIINIPKLLEYFDNLVKEGKLKGVLEEIIHQSKIEFNFLNEDDE